MGQAIKKDKLSVQKERMKNVFNTMLDSEIAIMQFQLTLACEEEHIKGIKKVISQCKKAKEIISGIVHYEILVSLYNTFVNGRESFFVMLSSTIVSKNKVNYWDKTKKGFEIFKELEANARAQSQKDYEERKKQMEIVEQAKKDGKNVEYIYKDGKIQPLIVDDK